MTRPEDAVDPLLADFGAAQLARNGVPDDRARADRARCLELLQETFAGELAPEGVGCSVLGVEWTEVFDVPLRSAVPDRRLATAGWVPLDRLLGRRERGRSRRWAVVEDGRVLAGIRLLDGPADPVAAVLERCDERGEVRLREVLELRALRDRGHAFPLGSPVLRAAADIESGLGGRALAPWASGRSGTAPTPLRTGRRGIVVSVSGVDGSGKTTLRTALTDSLDRAGLPVSTVWVRPGMGLGWMTSLAAWGKRLMKQDATPGVRVMADPGAVRPASRQGLVGWVWAMLVTGSFITGVWRQHAAARGVVIYDRHLVDALATLDFAYEGVDLRVQRRLVRLLLPHADVRLYLDVPAEVSVRRKPDDLLGEHAVRRQLEGYRTWLGQLPPVVRLDATRPVGELLREALDALPRT